MLLCFDRTAEPVSSKMENPTIFEPYKAAPDIDVIPSWFPIPGFGILPVHAYLLRAAEPVLVDAGLASLSDAFMEKLSSIIDPRDIKWLWLTHNDQDHIGGVQRLLEAAPGMRIITTFLGLQKMRLFQPLPMDRVYLLNPGQSLDVGDRTLISVKPPTYDAPETTGFFDPKTAAYFSSDCFGTLMSEPTENAAEIGSSRLRDGLISWATVDFPWLHGVNQNRFVTTLNQIRELSPNLILSNHLPPAHNITDELLRYLADVPASKPFIGPDQQALEVLLKGKAKGKTPTADIVSKAREFLATGRYLQLATVTRDGRPSLRNIAYVIIENKIYFLTDYASDKYREIRDNSSVACLISIDEEDWSKTLQLKIEGQARLETNQETIGKVKTLLGEKYSGMKGLPPNPGQTIFGIVPETGYLMDNSRELFSNEKFSF